MVRIIMALLCLSLLSCFSSSKKEATRTPASEIYVSPEYQDYVKNTPFAQDGYDHNTNSGYTSRHFQVGSSLSQEQEIRELAGREIWFKSAPNERLHTYYFPQKLNSAIAWYRVMRADRHKQRFNSFGLINDPDCCVPGQDCADKKIKLGNGRTPTMADTFGWEFCPNDEALLESLKNPNAKWIDPACNHPILKAADALDKKPREDRCEMAFGNATGAVGYRKFPNPRFNLARWNKIGGWEGYEKRMSESQIDASVEPPFRIGKACASCHAAFDPLNPPSDLANPTWRNIKGETGNQYLNISAIMGSGTKENTIEYQMFVHARPGTADTSAVPMDFVNNPGTINALINLPQRPFFAENVSRWTNVDSCSGSNCQQINYPNGQKKFWEYKKSENMKVMHILKGGEDSVGADLAVQRVYVNIGMCAEQCWVNHLSNLRELDSSQRGFGQTPFDIKQCRQDCASWRANEDRVDDVLSYLTSRRPTDLKDAIYKDRPVEERGSALENFFDREYGGKNLIGKGKQIFAQNCAECHSSQNPNKNDMSGAGDLSGFDFMKKEVLENGEEIRADWMGNDKSTPALAAGTFKCRALHSNHMTGRVYQDFSSNSYKAKKATMQSVRSKDLEGGRGYYRNISLLNVWAHAPFMHNNAVGPEICGKERDPNFNTWRSAVPGKQTDPVLKYTCDSYFDPTVTGRLKLFEQSVDELLTPSNSRRPKEAKTDVAIQFPLGVSLSLFRGTQPLSLEFPKGMSITAIGSFDIKRFGLDMMGALPLFEEFAMAAPEQKTVARAKFDQYWVAKFSPNDGAGKEIAQTAIGTFEFFRQMMTLSVQNDMANWLARNQADQQTRLKIYMKHYTNCDALYENLGHDFGTGLSSEDKKALKAFLATL